MFFFVLYSLTAYTQSIINSNDYLDPVLYNGRIYSFFPPQNISGHQYLINEETLADKNIFYTGQIILDGNSFNNIFIKYDIYNQKLLLKISFRSGGEKIIEISEDKLQSFAFDDKNFVLEKLDKNNYKIFQTIGNERIKLYYYWFKRLDIKSGSNAGSQIFTKALKIKHLKKDSQIIRFNTNRMFIMLFEEKNQEELKKYIRKNKLNVKKASEEQMLKLINFCNTL